jgi:hypothetical protein
LDRIIPLGEGITEERKEDWEDIPYSKITVESLWGAEAVPAIKTTGKVVVEAAEAVLPT